VGVRVSLLIATPVRGAAPLAAPVCFGYAESVRRLSRLMPTEELHADLAFPSDIVRARNRIAALILRDWPQIDNVLWWDDDEWPEDVRVIPKMLAKGEDLIGLPYTNKRMPVRWLHSFLPEPPVVRNEMLEVRGVGFGLTLTSRACLMKMSAAARKYTDHPTPHKVANIFGQLYDHVDMSPGDSESEDMMLLGEDFSFCKRWRELGGRVMVYAGKGNMVAHAGAHAFTAREMPGGAV
jgi:hypothetical protein